MRTVRYSLLPASAVLFALLTSAAGAEPDANSASMCGRSGSIVDLLISMQKPSVEAVWRDRVLFIYHDKDDDSIWGFSIENSSAHPAAMCQRRVKDGDGTKIETGQICTASEKVCKSFVSQVTERGAKQAAETKK